MKPAFQKDDTMINLSKLNQLYTEIYEPKLLPQDLLENLNLDNYISVNFINKDGNTQAFTKCYLTDGSIAEYVYTFIFSKLYRLEEIVSENNLIVLYDRESEILKLKEELISESKFSNVS